MAQRRRRKVQRRITRRRSRRSRQISSKAVAVLVVLLILGTASVAFTQNLFAGDFVELDTIEVHGDLLVLGANCLGMSGSISEERGQAIQLGLDGDLSNRPNVYDVFRDVTEQFGIEVESVRITRIEDNNFLSVLTLSTDDKILYADARPSDAIAIALRTASPIYFNRTFLLENGVDICNQTSE